MNNKRNHFADVGKMIKAEKATIYDYVRMCKNHKGCRGCLLSVDVNGMNIACLDLVRDYPGKANEIILKWCKEHPIKTRQDEFLKMFPNAKTDSDGIIIISPCSMEKNMIKTTPGTCSCIHGSCNECSKKYWLAER